MLNVRPLEGLPVYGPRALSFPKPDAFREGFVVEFDMDDGEPWVGNFAQFDDRGLNQINLELGAHTVAIVAGGVGYVVDVSKRRLVREIGFGIIDMWFEASIQAMVATNGLWFEAFTGERMLWKSRRISWDGTRNVDRDGLIVTGEACDPTAEIETWRPFRIDLATGEVQGGSYLGPE
jgi:hypothetical protein